MAKSEQLNGRELRWTGRDQISKAWKVRARSGCDDRMACSASYVKKPL